MRMKIICGYCKSEADLPTGAVNRARKKGAAIYCNRVCAGLGRRKGKTREQRIEDKRLYDAEYRVKNKLILKKKKAEFFQKTYDPDAARIERKKRAHKHLEYIRKPEYKQWKSEYDRKLRAKSFGPFAEAYLVLLDVQREIASRMDKYEIYLANGTLNKKLRRKREYENFISG
jgi:hypothetical protein